MFVVSGVGAPVRDIAAAAGVGMGTIYRHFPTRADLIIAVYRHQVDACAEAGPALLESSTPHAALAQWIDLFVDFLVTKHGLAAALQSGDTRFESLHAYFLDRLVPVCARLLGAAAAAGEAGEDVNAYELLRAIGNLCAGTEGDPRYDALRMVRLLVDGLLRAGPTAAAGEPAGQADGRLRVRQAGRVVLLDPDHRVLLMRYDDGPPNGVHWSTPGGGLNPGEDYAAGARRELAEETGWHDIELADEIFRRSHVMEYADVIVRQAERFFLARTGQPGRAITGVGAMHAADGIAAWRWWSLAELDATEEAIWPAELPDLVRAACRDQP